MSPARIYVASSNPGKLADFAAAAKEHDIEVLPLPRLNEIAPPEETGSTFEENAKLKAEYYSLQLPGLIVFADDSGLTVDALAGEPGVRSARYAEDARIMAGNADEANNQLLLHRAAHIPDANRTCAFVASIAAARDGVTLATFQGKANGVLLRAARGSNGFGYDPLFYFPELKSSFAELSREEKLRVSHRGEAFRKFLHWIEAHPAETAT